VISQVVPKENLAADPMRRVRYGENNNPHLLTGMGSGVSGAGCRIRTDHIRLTRAALYQMS
jgi:hypothetical protein